jgi:TPR repeat protein
LRKAEQNEKIYFGTATEFRVIESGSGSPETASIPATPLRIGFAREFRGEQSSRHRRRDYCATGESGKDGNMLAQQELGAIYFAGYGTIARDYKKSVFWFQKAVDQNP